MTELEFFKELSEKTGNEFIVDDKVKDIAIIIGKVCPFETKYIPSENMFEGYQVVYKKNNKYYDKNFTTTNINDIVEFIKEVDNNA